MQPAKLKAGYGMTLSACLWFGLFPLLQGGTYARITHDKWIIMLALSGVTLLCFLFDLATRRLSQLSMCFTNMVMENAITITSEKLLNDPPIPSSTPPNKHSNNL